MKKIMVILVVMIMLFSVSVCADDHVSTKNYVELLRTENAIISIEAKDLSKTVLYQLLESGLMITDNSLVEILPIEGTNDTAICLAILEGNTITKEILISYYEDTEGNIKIDNSLAVSLAPNSVNATYPADYGNSSYRVYAQAITEVYVNGLVTYYRPYKCSFYYDKNTEVDVSSVSVSYVADGFLYSQSTYTSLGLPEYEHITMVSKSDPIQGITYSNTNYMPSGRVLHTSSGSPTVGHFFMLMVLNIVIQ